MTQFKIIMSKVVEDTKEKHKLSLPGQLTV